MCATSVRRWSAGTSSVCLNLDPYPPRNVPLGPTTNGPVDGPRLLDVAAAAECLAVSSWTIRDLVERGSLVRIVLPGVHRLLFDRWRPRQVDRGKPTRELSRSLRTSRWPGAF